MAVVDILDKINILGDAFEINNFNIDQLKILFAALALSNHVYQTERILLFKITAEKENCTYNDIKEICYAHVEHTADVRRVENPHSAEINAVQKPADYKLKGKDSKSRTKPAVKNASFSQCCGCDRTTHKREDYPFINANCRICKTTDYIARVCLSKGKKTVRTVQLQAIVESGSRYRKYAEILLNGKQLGCS